MEPVESGPEFRVNQDFAAGNSPRVAVDAEGRITFVWHGGGCGADVCGRRFERDGTPLGDEFEVSQSTFADYSPGGHDESLALDANAAGRFVVAWVGVDDYTYPRCHDGCVQLRRFDENGVALGGTFQVGPGPDRYATSPEVALFDSGDHVVAWVGGAPDSDPVSAVDVIAQRFAADGTPLGSRFRANSFHEEYQGDYGYASMESNGEGEFVVVWEGEGPGGEGVYGRRFRPDGRGDGRDFTVAPDGLGFGGPFYFSPEVAVAESGDFIVAWEQTNQYVIRARTFGRNRKPSGPVLRVSGHDGIEPGPDGGGEHPSVASDREGNFVVVWRGFDSEVGADRWGAFGRAFDALGNPRGSAFRANTATAGDQGYGGTDVALDDEGQFVVVWLSEIDRKIDILAQRFELPPVSEVRLAGRRLEITNRVPSSPKGNRVAWRAKAGNVLAGERGSALDPRCNGDSPGTVKAMLRFFSLDSGADTGPLELPCQNWRATGPAGDRDRQGYRYADRRLEDGLCKTVVLRHRKELRAICAGRVGGPDVAYDLTAGVGEGTVHATLEVGGLVYCSALEGNRADGSDGRRFLGRNAEAPDACPGQP